MVSICLSLAPQGAEAVIVSLRSGKKLSYLSDTRSLAAPFSSPFSTPAQEVEYLGGPVMPAVEAIPFYWDPPGLTPYPSSYQQGIEEYLKNVAADSGGRPQAVVTNTVAEQYDDGEGVFANYIVSVGKAIVDEEKYPPSGCSDAEHCLTPEEVTNGLGAYLSAHGLAGGFERLFIVLLPPNVPVCFTEGGTTPTEICSPGGTPTAHSFCAYHSSFQTASGEAVIFSVDPFIKPYEGATEQCVAGPELHPPAEGVIRGITHELLESATDPIVGTGWVAPNGEKEGDEIADLCETDYGNQLGTVNGVGVPYNQLVNGVPYLYQEIFSERGHTCLPDLGEFGGAPAATITGTVTGLEGTFEAAPGATSYRWHALGGGQVLKPTTESGDKATFRFPKSGLYEITVDEQGAEGQAVGLAAVAKVTAAETTTLPKAEITLPERFVVGRESDLSASGSTGGAVGSVVEGIKRFGWRFFGSNAYAEGERVSVTFQGPGTYYVALTVENQGGSTGRKLVAVEAKREQQVAFTAAAPSDLQVGEAYEPKAKATSGEPVQLTVPAQSSAVCALSGGMVKGVAPGLCTVEAVAPGGTEYFPARAAQTVTVVAPSTTTTTTTTTVAQKPRRKLRFIALRRVGRRLLIRIAGPAGAVVRVGFVERKVCRRASRRLRCLRTVWVRRVKLRGGVGFLKVFAPRNLRGRYLEVVARYRRLVVRRRIVINRSLRRRGRRR